MVILAPTPDLRVAPPRPPAERLKQLADLAEWHRVWTARNLPGADFKPRPGDYNLHYLDVDSSSEVEAQFRRRADEIMGVDNASHAARALNEAFDLLANGWTPEVMRNFDPGQLRVEHGEHGGEWTASGALKDALKLASRIHLDDGETLVGSDKVQGDYGTVRMAVTEKGGRRSVRLGLGDDVFGGRHDEAGPWRGDDATAAENARRAPLRAERDALEVGAELTPQQQARFDELDEMDLMEIHPSGYTAQLDDGAVAQLRKALADSLDRALRFKTEDDARLAEIDKLEARRQPLIGMDRKWTDAEDARWDDLTAKIDALEAADPYPGGNYPAAEGSIPGQRADVHYQVYYDDGEVHTAIGAVPHSSGLTLADLTGKESAASLDPSEVQKLLRLLDKVTPPNAARSWSQAQAALHPRETRSKRFVPTADRIAGALHDWLNGSNDEPLKPFSREQVRTVAKARGLNPKRGASEEDIKDLLLADARKSFGDRKSKARADYQALADRKPHAEAGAELSELLAKGADNKTIAEHIRAHASGPSMDEVETSQRLAVVADLETVASAFDSGDEKLGAERMAAVLEDHGLALSESAGKTVAFDGNTHRPVGDVPADGAKVKVLRPGVTYRRAGGGDVVLSEPVVTTASGRTSAKRAPRADLPAAKRAPAKAAPEVDAEDAARVRQKVIDEARQRANVLAEVHQLLNDGQDDPAVFQHRAQSNARLLGDDASMAPLLRALESADRAKIRRALGTTERKLGFRKSPTGRRPVGFTGSEHEAVGAKPAPGTRVDVLRPGYSFTHDGEDIRLSKAKVIEAEPLPAKAVGPAKKTAPKRAPSKKATQPSSVATEGRDLTRDHAALERAHEAGKQDGEWRESGVGVGSQVGGRHDAAKGGYQGHLALAQEQGFDGPPRVLSSEAQFDRLESQGWTPLYRGWGWGDAGTGKSGRELADQYLYGDLHVGGGLGLGTNMSDDYSAAAHYEGGNRWEPNPNGRTVRFLLSPDAKVIRLPEAERMRDAYLASLPAGHRYDAERDLFADPGTFAMARGYDAMVANRDEALIVKAGTQEWVVLNRTALVAFDENSHGAADYARKLSGAEGIDLLREVDEFGFTFANSGPGASSPAAARQRTEQMDALAAKGYLRKDGTKYRITNAGRDYLSGSSGAAKGVKKASGSAAGTTGAPSVPSGGGGHLSPSPPDAKFEILPRPARGAGGDGRLTPGGPWGLYGAAGVLVRTTGGDGEPRYLLVKTGSWVDAGGRWQLPGGALDEHESPYQGTAREVAEEVGVDRAALRQLAPAGEHVLTHPSGWTYTTILADSPQAFETKVDGSETTNARWLTADEIRKLADDDKVQPDLAKVLPQLLGSPVPPKAVPGGASVPKPKAATVDTHWRPVGVTAQDEARLRQALKQRQPIAGLPGASDVDYVDRLSVEQTNERLLGQFVARSPQLGRMKDAAEVKADLARRAKAAFAERPVSVGLGTGSLEAVLRDGRLKSQLETGSSGGVYQPELRIQRERVWFGLPLDLDPASRPIYGYLAPSDGPQGVVTTYGDVQVVLKDSIRSRTTAMVGDSMGYYLSGAPGPLDDPGWRAFTPHEFEGSPIGQLERDYDGAAFNHTHYIEAQIHGGVTTDDIAEVVLPSAPSPELRRLLEQAGVKWRMRKSTAEEGIRPKADSAPSTPKAPKVTGRDISGEVDYEALPPAYNLETNRDDALREVLRRQGFDGRPEVVSASAFDAAVRRGEVRETWRGFTRSRFSQLTPEQMAEEYRTGDMRAGIGINGNGTYVAIRKEDGEYYGFTLLRIGLRSDAKVISADDLDAEMDAFFASAEEATQQHRFREREYLDLLARAKTPRARANLRRQYRADVYGADRRTPRLAIMRDPGRFAAMRGYDAIEIPKQWSPDKHAEMIILNRAATIVQEA